MSDNSTSAAADTLIKEVRIAIDWALGKGYGVQLTSTQLDDAASAVISRLGLRAQPLHAEDETGNSDGVQVIGHLNPQIWT
ncbi:hypothetical protein D2E76_16330 [Mycobacteroides abscessus]|uniref:Bacteriophage protein n=1 Tax=Mycobacteroides abscessus TaxID=36809 RepID=A0ABD7HLT7_9MYCO|nr:hypothetical protein [Mycobacteroides abscessus]RIT36819.1 hypothetical protein D2E76_16330 [Mycobacteroides abscessus]